mmetsp:Transcript_10919/g.21667  ORF Transcript_10919/g.21667 Transcript_10919/m.21667 type:complete len:209 (+) Transcript_10919:110-736(+)
MHSYVMLERAPSEHQKYDLQSDEAPHPLVELGHSASDALAGARTRMKWKVARSDKNRREIGGRGEEDGRREQREEGRCLCRRPSNTSSDTSSFELHDRRKGAVVTVAADGSADEIPVTTSGGSSIDNEGQGIDDNDDACCKSSSSCSLLDCSWEGRISNTIAVVVVVVVVVMVAALRGMVVDVSLSRWNSRMECTVVDLNSNDCNRIG